MPLLALKLSCLTSNSLSMSFFQLNNYTALEISGERVSDFLQGQITSDITQSPIKFKTLFCDEKGYVITNAYVILNDSALIMVKKGVHRILEENLKKFIKFYRCSIEVKDIESYGEFSNGKFFVHLGSKKTDNKDDEWDRLKIVNFDIDIYESISNKFRVNELGYNLEDYVSFDKGCYRGQEIIARINYLSKGSIKPVIFKDISNKNFKYLEKEGKFLFSAKIKESIFYQFMLREGAEIIRENTIKPIASLWEFS